MYLYRPYNSVRKALYTTRKFTITRMTKDHCHTNAIVNNKCFYLFGLCITGSIFFILLKRSLRASRCVSTGIPRVTRRSLSAEFGFTVYTQILTHIYTYIPRGIIDACLTYRQRTLRDLSSMTGVPNYYLLTG
jgi:hypothetical protein